VLSADRETRAGFLRKLFGGPRRLPVVLQAEQGECGLACLAMIAAYYGDRRGLHGFRPLFQSSLKGVSLQRILEIASALDLSPRPVRLPMRALARLKRPAMLHWDLSHFVVLVDVADEALTIHDPAKGRREISVEEAARHFTGVAVEFTPTPAFQTRPAPTPAKFSDLWSKMSGLWSSISQVIALTVALQLLALIAPLYTQIIVDEVIVKGDLDLLGTLAVGFAILFGIQSAVTVGRTYISLYINNALTFQMRVNLLSHLIRLRLPFFEQRHLGDIVSRFQSLAPVQDLFTSGVIVACLDAIVALTTLVVIFLYSPQLAAIALVFLIASVAIQLATFPKSRELSQERIQEAATENSLFLENIRSIRTIKGLAIETRRENAWQDSYVESMNSGFRLAKLNMWVGFWTSLLASMEVIIFLYLGATFVISGTMTLGMLFAFQAYRQQFLARMGSLTQFGLSYLMVRLHLERLADIVHCDREVQASVSNLPSDLELEGRIELKQVSFRYSDDDPYILRDLELTIEPGTSILITGVSGSGKTTLCKIFLGLLEPTDGQLVVDGQLIERFGLSSFRRKVGSVSQEDTLFSGSVAENITAFDEAIDWEKMRKAAATAGILSDIERNPLGFYTLVGDMGSSLSGGQRQRILLARAFYKGPRLIVLDEGTANLDHRNEELVSRALADMPVTRIVFGHRTFFSELADRVFVLEQGRLREITGERSTS